MDIIGNSSSPYIENVWLVDGLKHNLLSISQLYDNGYKVVVDKNNCIVINPTNKSIFFIGKRKCNVYKINFSDLAHQNVVCLLSMSDKKWIWHKDESYDVFNNFCAQVQNEKELKFLKIISDHGGEFENGLFETFWKNMKFSKTLLVLKPHHKMGLWRERIKLYKKWLKP